MFVAPELIKLKPVEDVLSPVSKIGFVAKTRSPVPVVSVITPRICVAVVAANDARVSDVYATLPPCLRFVVIDEALLSDVRTRSL